MTKHTATFSRQVKKELISATCENSCCKLAAISATILMADKSDEQIFVMSLSNNDVADYFRELMTNRSGQRTVRTRSKDGSDLIVISKQTVEEIGAKVTDYYEITYSPEEKIVLRCKHDCCMNSMLRAFFLLCGSISEPKKSYHVEFKTRRQPIADFISSLLKGMDMHTLILRRNSFYYVYVQEGQHIADILLLSGAHKAFMDFELLRVEKEMRNTVNRVVNCDSANTQRIADTAARQLQLIRRIKNTTGLSILPPHLQAAAEARLDYPDLSLKELGEQLNPPIGKSGMNHRLKKIELLAGQLKKTNRKKKNHET